MLSWSGFWAPQLIQWIVGGAITAIVGTVVGLVARFLLKRWYDRVGKPWLETWLKSIIGVSHQAVDASELAVQHAKGAGDDAREAKKVALELQDSTGRIVEWLPEGDEAVEYLKETNSRLVAQLVIQATKHPEDFESPNAPRPEIPGTGVEQAAVITGKHRLVSPETMRLQVLTEQTEAQIP